MREIFNFTPHNLGISLFIGYALLVWFRTNAFAEYLTLFKLSRFFYVGSYNELVSNGYEGGYIDFLREYYHDLFLVRLATCPICFGFWLSLPFLDLSVNNIIIIPLGLFFYSIFNKLL